MDKVKVGVVGTGALGRHHARLYCECEQAEVVGIFDSNEETLARVAGEFDIKPYPDLDELLAGVDAVSVAVPTDLHLKVVTDFLERGKHVLVEKPLASNSEEGRKLVDLAKSKGLVLHVGHVENFNPVIRYLRSKLTSPLFIEAHRLASYPPPRPGLLPRGTEVGVVHDLMIHDLDLLLDLVGCKVTKVDAVGMPVLSPTEDIANVRLEFENGCVANVTSSRISPERMRKIRVFQPDAYLSLDYETQDGVIHTKTATGIEREPVPMESCNALKVELDDFVSCVAQLQEDGSVPTLGVSGARGLAALELADQIVALLKEHIDKHDNLRQALAKAPSL